MLLHRERLMLRDLVLLLLLDRRVHWWRLALRFNGSSLALLLHRSHRRLFLLWRWLIARLHRRRSVDIAIGSERLAHHQTSRAAMVDAGELSLVGTGSMLILHLRLHWRSVFFMASRQFRGAGSHRQSTLPAGKADTRRAPVFTDRMAVDVVHDCDVDVVDRTVVVKMAALPVAALVADTHVAEAVVDSAVVADVRTPVASVKSVMVMPVAPVARGPESPLIGSLNPHAGYPVVAALTPCPVPRRPEIVVARSLRLVVVGQRRRRLIRGFDWLRTVAGIVRALVSTLVRGLVVT